MKRFVNNLILDLRRIGWKQSGLLTFLIFAVYGMLLVNPTSAYDFSAAKGDFLQVFLTHFFMNRPVRGVVAGLFHDFTPFWNWSFGLLALFVFAHLLCVLARRIGLSEWQSTVFVMIWLSAPFFFNISIYQHAMPAGAIAFCVDALVILVFAESRDPVKLKSRVKYIIAAGVCGFVALGFYQAHADLLLTAMLGVCCVRPKRTWKEFFVDIVEIVAILVVSVFMWALVSWGPILIANAFGLSFPPSGGAHDTIYWFDASLSFAECLTGLFVGLLLNWVYNSLFVVGLRWVLFFVAVGCAISVCKFVANMRKDAAYIVLFVMSIFAMPCFICSSANLRIFLCFSPFIAFSAMVLLSLVKHRKTLHVVCAVLLVVVVLSLAHETSTLYYYQWKLKSHDALHMGNVATDIWRKYGLSPDKPVAVIGGWSHYPTCWEDMRPNRDLPLLNKPFSSYSNMSDANVPREFYMVAREKVGLVVDMPPADVYEKAKQLTGTMPAYPQNGYIFEKDGLIVVNLGEHVARWKRFDFKAYRSPNERLLFKSLREDKWLDFKQRMIKPFLNLAKKYPWTLST